MRHNVWAVGAVRLLMIKKHTNMNAKEFLAQKGVYNLDTKKRYNEVITWMEEYAALHQPIVIKSVCDHDVRNFKDRQECEKCGEVWIRQ